MEVHLANLVAERDLTDIVRAGLSNQTSTNMISLISDKAFRQHPILGTGRVNGLKSTAGLALNFKNGALQKRRLASGCGDGGGKEIKNSELEKF
jgi:hypothetical protein